MMYKTWTEEKSNAIVQLQKEGKTHKEIGAIVGADRHAVTGRLWRIKVKNGYTVPKSSLWGKKRNTVRSPDNEKDIIGERLCNVCQQNFSYTSRYQRFCWPCKSKISRDGYTKYTL
jgi:hypothetical protein